MTPATTGGIKDLTNTAISGLSGYSASVSVAAAALGTITAASGDALRITVSVTDPGGNVITLDGYRTRHAPNASL
jgi:MSHA pilin protein MshD